MSTSYRIKEFRERLKMTQEELAEKANISRALISGLESGTIKETSTASLKKLANALKVNVSEIFFEEVV
ncbi:helix-turn-helix transcriptional regulator [Aerococcaceae bacterium zg-B36]|uniref:helix-turn-helix domain-containing protein n=1 Tax=Aerococcaceae bacterium zg-252 TaxID=2796928 RepID=UPI001BD7FBF7|nr:helix-turn-helix transcriptional regulator [Aerococcaceae bacterium zg-B36]